MKIFYFANLKWPTSRAHGIQLAKMCEAFVNKGVDLTLIVPECKESNKVDFQEFYGLTISFPVVKLPVFLSNKSNRTAFNFSAFCFALSSLYFLWRNRLGDSIVYTIDLDQFSFFTLPVFCKNVFIEMHGSKRKSLFTKYFFGRVTGILAVSAGVRDKIKRDFNISDERISVFPNGIDENTKILSQVTIKAKRAFDGAPIILYVGRIYDWKGLDALVTAAGLMEDKATFVIVGGSVEELKHSTGRSVIPSSIRCLGFVRPEEVPSYMAVADILVVTATKRHEYSYEETSPMKLFEYMSSRRPVVVADTPAIRSVVSEREVYFYEPDDGEDLARVIRSVLASSQTEKRNKIDVAEKKARQNTWGARTERIIKFMNKF